MSDDRLKRDRARHGGDPAPSSSLKVEADIILTAHPGHEGIWVRRMVHYSPHQMQTAVEMAMGKAAVHKNQHGDTYFIGRHQSVRIANERQWAFLCGLVICDQAERIAL